ncbi:hypothetical protein [Chitinophaga solisilvae]|uniref:hypothetical protein n=1 Tax=Chitinophaga solisilvae TaxID=1233460 RepID=UPI00136DE208|nr:hypothetical protein [Chitinophaga solisilvae]
MRLRFIVFPVSLLFPLFTLGQYQQHLPKAKPIPPNAAAMFKVLERPLGTFTGTIPISFPLCSVNSGPLSANISLSYNNTGGIRVEELSGCVGLGFSLADGAGRITQMVNGKPDDSQLGMLMNPFARPSTFNVNNLSHMAELGQDRLDLEPDVFLYNFNGRSGKFFLKENGDVIMMTNDAIDITYTRDSSQAPPGPGIRSWIITDENGHKYYFGRNKAGTGDLRIVNQSTYNGNGGSSPSETSSVSWHLAESYDMNEENSIKYSYVTTGDAFTTISGSFMPLTTAGLDCRGFNVISDIGTVTTSGTEYMVSRIDAGSGYLIFNAAPDYTYGPKRLLSIQQYDPNGNFRGKFTFNYGPDFTSNRFKLSSFSQFGAAGTDSLTHKFEYIESVALPTVLNPAVDIWGFFNGKANLNSGLIPNLIFSNGANDFYWDYWAIRTADPYYGKANVLRKITYPTGGYREIEYEGNEVLGLGDFFIYHPDSRYMVSRSFSESNFRAGGTTSPSLQHAFTVNTSFNISRVTFNLGNLSLPCGNNFSIKFMRVNSPGDLNGGYLIQSFDGQRTGSLILKNGNYRVDIYSTSLQFPCTAGTLSCSWLEGVPDTTTVQFTYGNTYQMGRRSYYAGGVRVKSLTDYDPVTGKSNVTSYRYKMYSNDSTVGSGLLASPVNIMSLQNTSTTGCQYFKVFPGSSYPLASDNGSFVVYPEVRTIESNNGWTDRIFAYMYNNPPTGFPPIPPVDPSYYRGKLLKEKVYRQDGTLLRKTEQQWIWSYPPSQPGYKAKPYWQVDGLAYIWTDIRRNPGNCNDIFNDCIPDYAAQSYYTVTMPVVALAQATDSSYAGNIAMGAQTSYSYYLHDYIYLLKQKKITINNNQTREQTYKYAFTPSGEFSLGLNAGELAMKDTLLKRHYLQPVEVTDSIKKNGLSPLFINGSKYVFSFFNSNKLHLSQFRNYFSKTDSAIMYFSGYDAKGNLTEQYKANDIKEVFLWGYNGNYPVAQVTGSNYATVAGLVNLSILNNPASDNALRTELNKIRSGLPAGSALVNTFTYSPLYSGMSSQTGPEGRIAYYEYDSFGRLQRIKDKDGNIIKLYDFQIGK